MQSVAEAAVRSIGLGFDVVSDIRLNYCKQRDSPDPCLIELDHGEVQDIVLPGGLTVAGVTKSVKCDKGERQRLRSDVLSFQQMSEQFNQELSLSGRIPSGLFNTMFEFTGSWQKDAANNKSLAFDGWFITLYSVALSKGQTDLRDHVKRAVPSTWESASLARFIKQFGTHIVVGLKMGGKDLIYLKQQCSSSLQAVDVQKRLKEMSERRFDINGQSDTSSKETRENKDLVMMPKRRGGRDKDFISHSEWLSTVQAEPDVISMSFIPITSLLNGVPRSGFLNHAINLYLRHKPPIEELHQFLEFQLPRQWAPVYTDLALGPPRRRQNCTSLPVNLIGPKLYVYTDMVDVGKRPVTGLRLILEGRESNKLAIHLQHLCSLPKIIQLEDDPYNNQTQEYDPLYYEPIGSWKHLSHVCTALVESDDLSIVTECPPNLVQKLSLISTLISTSSYQEPPPRPVDVNINSGVFSGDPPVQVCRSNKLLKFVDPTEMMRGPQDKPGYWVVSGAKLNLERGNINEFSVLNGVRKIVVTISLYAPILNSTKTRGFL